jgi:hypothetical protein
MITELFWVERIIQTNQVIFVPYLMAQSISISEATLHQECYLDQDMLLLKWDGFHKNNL